MVSVGSPPVDVAGALSEVEPLYRSSNGFLVGLGMRMSLLDCVRASFGLQGREERFGGNGDLSVGKQLSFFRR